MSFVHMYYAHSTLLVAHSDLCVKWESYEDLVDSVSSRIDPDVKTKTGRMSTGSVER
jgi:hypothetical protein